MHELLYTDVQILAQSILLSIGVVAVIGIAVYGLDTVSKRYPELFTLALGGCLVGAFLTLVVLSGWVS